VVAALPWAEGESSPTSLANVMGTETSGLMDFRAGMTTWLINDPERANYLGVSAMVVAPTGAYDSQQLLNPGENRWKWVLYGGWQRDITPRLLFELSPEIALYGKNEDYRGGGWLKQAPSYALTGYLRWRLSPQWHLHVGGQLNRGGETEINGIDQHNAPNTGTVMGGVTLFLPRQQQLILRYSRDTTVDHQMRGEQTIGLRYQITY
jgi:hypothetical protein